MAAIHSQPEVGVKHRNSYRAVAVVSIGFCFLATVLSAQESTNRPHIGAPQDWSQRHIIFSRDALLQHPDLISQEPRVLHQAMQRWQGRYSSVVPGVDMTEAPAASGSNQVDWSVTLKGRLSPNMFPSKFSFDLGAPPSCQNDYVVYGTNSVGVTGGNANLVAFNNLYAGTGGLCGSAPTVLFAYNITTVTGVGRISTSPVLSLDGTKIAFVESVGGTAPAAIFHVLTWIAGQGGISIAADPGAAMTSLTFSPTKTDTASSPWVDYLSDVAYVGADDGKIHKITGVFKGTPTEVVGGTPWPVTVSTNLHLTPPVLDNRLGLLMVGSANGNLYQIDTTTGALKSLAVGDKNALPNHGILAPPIVDVTNGTTFVVSSNGVNSSGGNSGVLVEADTLSLTELARANIGLASASGTSVNLYQPAFSDSYFTDPSTGVVRLCGTGDLDITPFQYAFSFTGRTMQTTTPAFKQQLVTSTLARCTGWTEVFNPKIGVGGTDFFFFGLDQDCTAPGNGPTDGCVVARTSDSPILTKQPVVGGPTGIVIDNVADPALFGQASSIYLMSKNNNIAFKFKQTLGP
jgi:hypothetical protein